MALDTTRLTARAVSTQAHADATVAHADTAITTIGLCTDLAVVEFVGLLTLLVVLCHQLKYVLHDAPPLFVSVFQTQS